MRMNEGKQSLMPGFEMALADRGRQAIGHIGEMVAWAMLEKAGFQVSYGHERRCDLRCTNPDTGETHYIEVKTARRGKTDRKWRFLLWKKGSQDHTGADYVLLLAALDSGLCVPFLVPVEVLEKQHQAVISCHPLNYNGKLAAYRQFPGDLCL
jgi:hypothetical protein